MMRPFIFILIFPVFVFAQTGFAPSKAEQVKIYSQVIAEYIKAVSNDKLSYDTLFIGNHEEFPKIQLPDNIELKKIYLLTYVKSDKRPDNKSFILINIIEETFTKENAKFMIITFHKGYKPQHNCHVNLKYNLKTKQYELFEKIKFEYSYINNK